MAGWVGMEARAPMAAYFDGAPVTLSAKTQSTADRLDLVVRDASGTEVQRIAIPPSGGAMEWTGLHGDGSAFAPGLYSFETEAFANGVLLGTQPSEVYAPIVEARTEGGATVLITRGGVEVPASDITALRDPAGAP